MEKPNNSLHSEQHIQPDFSSDPLAQKIFAEISAQHPEECQYLTHLLHKAPLLQDALSGLLLVFDALVKGFEAGKTLFLCGNGGSFADCLHISGELMKSFKRKRPLSESGKTHFAGLEFGDLLAAHLEYGLPCVVLGLNHALASAVLNDYKIGELQYAQELYALGKQGDMLLGISTSGNALNVLYAISTAKTLGMCTLGLTGTPGGKLAQAADIVVRVPETSTESIQEQHIMVYHTLCAMIEARFFTVPQKT